MSTSARRYRKRDRKLCACGKPALYYSWAKRRYRFSADHGLCGRCHRSLKTSALAGGIRLGRIGTPPEELLLAAS